MLYVIKLLFTRLITAIKLKYEFMKIDSRQTVVTAQHNKTVELPKVEPKVLNQKPDYLGFIEFLRDKDLDYAYRIVNNTILEYGTIPQRFIIVYDGPEFGYYISFYQGTDPMFAAALFVLARDFLGMVSLAESFLYRREGSLALGTDADYNAIYSEYLISLTSSVKPTILEQQEVITKNNPLSLDLYTNNADKKKFGLN